MFNFKDTTGSSGQSIIAWSALALLITSLVSIGFFQSDEHFQILEFAALKLGKIDPSLMPWEYEYQMRPAFQPLLALLIHQGFSFVGIENPFIITTALRILSAIVSLLGMWSIYLVYRDKYEHTVEKKWFTYLSFLWWCSIFVGVRFSSEGWSGSLFLIGFSFYFLHHAKQRFPYFLTGLLLGLAFLCRYQVSLMVFGFGLWLLFVKREKWMRILQMAAGFVFVMGCGILIDHWYYGEWTWTFWHYIDQNIIHDRVSDFGIDPWWNYLMQITLALVPPFSLVPIFLFLYLLFQKPKDVIIWTLLPFLFIHFMIGHKELRFLFPALGFVPVMVMEGIQLFEKKSNESLFNKKWVKKTATVFVWINSLLILFICTTSFDRTTPLYRFIYHHFPEPTTLYYMGTDPYKQNHLTYYKRSNLKIIEIKSVDELPASEIDPILLIVDRPGKLEASQLNQKLIYSSIPGWVWHINFNHWIERTLAWYLFEIPGATEK